MPPSLPLMERMAAHSMHKHHHRLEQLLQSNGRHPRFGQVIIRDALLNIPKELDQTGSGTGHLNWKILQVRA